MNALNRTRYSRKNGGLAARSASRGVQGVSLPDGIQCCCIGSLIICQFCILGPSLLGRSFSTIYRRYGKPYSVILFLPLHNKTAPPLSVDVANLLVNHVKLLSCFVYIFSYYLEFRITNWYQSLSVNWCSWRIRDVCFKRENR